MTSNRATFPLSRALAPPALLKGPAALFYP